MKIKVDKKQKVLIIGDIHGCYYEFFKLIEEANIEIGKDIIISLGDIIDKGYETKEVFDFFINTPNTFMIMGNHEFNHLRNIGFRKFDISPEIEKLRLNEKDYSTILNYAKTIPYFLELEINNKNYLLVHGKYKESIDLNAIPNVYSEGDEKNIDIKYLIGMVDSFKKEDIPWFELLPQDKKVIFGHIPKEEVNKGDNYFGIDTGCAEGNSLTGLLLPDERLFQIKSQDKYFDKLINEYSMKVYEEHYDSLTWKEKEELLSKNPHESLNQKLHEEFRIIEDIYKHIMTEVEKLKIDFLLETEEEKQSFGKNWDNLKIPYLSKEIKKCFFGNFSKETLYSYTVAELTDILDKLGLKND